VITEQDLQEAIAECEGERNPKSNTCIKLAAFYIIRNQLFGDKSESQPLQYSLAPNPQPESTIYYQGDSDFAQAIAGKDPEKMWAVVDELMSALSVLNPKLYRATIQKLSDL